MFKKGDKVIVNPNGFFKSLMLKEGLKIDAIYTVTFVDGHLLYIDVNRKLYNHDCFISSHTLADNVEKIDAPKIEEIEITQEIDYLEITRSLF